MLRPDPDTEFLAFSLPDALTHFALRPEVAGRAFQHGGGAVSASDADPKTIAAEADVDVIVTGTLLRAGDEVRVTTSSPTPPAGTLLWSHTAQTPLGDLFHVQDELTRAHRRLAGAAADDRRAALLQRDVPSSAKAYEFYLARQSAQLRLQAVGARARSVPALRRGRSALRAGVGAPRPDSSRDGQVPPDRARRDGLGSGGGGVSKRALELNPDLPLAHKLFAQLEVDLGRAHDAMARLIERAQTRRPGTAGRTGQRLPLLRPARRLGGRARARARTRAEESAPACRTPGSCRRDHDARRHRQDRQNFRTSCRCRWPSSGAEDEALPALRELEQKIKTRIRDFIMAARRLLENRPAESIAAVGPHSSPRTSGIPRASSICRGTWPT